MGAALVGGLGDRSAQVGSRGVASMRVWGQSLQKPEECYAMAHEGDKNHLRREKSPYRLTLYDNIIIIISSTRHFLFSAIFVLKYKTATTSGCGATSAVQSAVF